MRGVVSLIWRKIDFNILCLHRKDVYLRKLGAKIGKDSLIITDIVNIGSEPYLVTLGDQVRIASGTKFITHDGSSRVFRHRFPEMNLAYGNLFGPITIDDNCVIGVNVVFLAGTHIGKNSVVGAGAVVKGDFPDNSVIAGVPARRLCSIDEYVERVREKMVIPLNAQTRSELRKELTEHFFGVAQ
jgi:acetyltransferase-like isoleucine patch superfamily enzyme